MQTKWIYQSNAIICHHTVRHDYPWWSVWWSWMVHVNDFDGIFSRIFSANFTSLRTCSWTTHGKTQEATRHVLRHGIFCRFTSWAVWKMENSTGHNQPNPPKTLALTKPTGWPFSGRRFDSSQTRFPKKNHLPMVTISQALGHYQNGTSFQDLWLYRRPNLWRSNLRGLSCLHTGPLRNDAGHHLKVWKSDQSI